ncbi:MAG: alpha/beta hydrolase [Oscillospiraceae bacterium]|nr:alpha/beta hydrolase [Oscillospiraceae bacterium]
MQKHAAKILKRITLTVFILLLLCAAFVGTLYGYNRHMLAKEAALIQHQGQYVEIDGANMNIYTTGSGDRTLVFMAGANTPAVIYDFKPLFSRLSDSFQIAVIEKFGYGCSDDISGERTLSTMLRQDREALEKVGIPAPYILCPHSASGLEAVRWAQLYPDEVAAIIGLDMAVPEQFDCQIGDIHTAQTQTPEQALAEDAFYNFWMYDIGSFRLYRFASVFPAAASPDLTAAEQAEYKAITYHWYSRFYETAMAREGILTDSQRSDFIALHDAPVPDVPTLFFVSNDSDMFAKMLGENGLEKWKSIHENYLAGLTHAKLVQLQCGHYVHVEEPEAVSNAIRSYLNETL